MFLKNIELKNFRNYKSVTLDFITKKTLLTGKNAQGKTNLLEAVYYLSALDSNRAKTDGELILWGEDEAIIKAQTNKAQTEIDLDVKIAPPKKKELKVNGLKKNKMSEFIRIVSAVSFNSSDLMLLRGQPEDRRKWLDLAISQVYPAYIERLSKYTKIRTQKNNYLKSVKGCSSINTDMLDVWNEQLSITGSNIVYLRIKFLKELINIAKVKHKEIIQAEELSLSYDCTFLEEFKEYTPEEISQRFLEKLCEKRAEELARAQSVVGPHRDDISFYINNIDSKKFASQGQQRTIVLALKLAEMELIKNKTDDMPILLLDDVLAELDGDRQNYLLNAISEQMQTIITSVDTLNFAPEFLSDVTIYKIGDSQIQKI